MARRLVQKLLSALDTSRSLSQNTAASLNSYRSRVQVKLTHFVRCVDRISVSRTAGGTTFGDWVCLTLEIWMGRMIATPKTANWLVFCQYTVCSLLFLTIFGPKLYDFVFSNVGRSAVCLFLWRRLLTAGARFSDRFLMFIVIALNHSTQAYDSCVCKYNFVFVFLSSLWRIIRYFVLVLW